MNAALEGVGVKVKLHSRWFKNLEKHERDEATEDKTPVLFYKKLPKDIANCFVLLVDPMLATAGECIYFLI